jgi:phytoene synthase
MTLAADHAACAAVLDGSGSSFALPIRLLSRAKRQGTTALYAFCRRADDIVDGAPHPQAAAAELDGFEHGLRTALGGGLVDDPVLRAVADTARRFAVPAASLFDILDGVRMDLEPCGFETFGELEEYCRRVASAVGVASIHVWGHLSPAALPAAHACGLAFQLTNILRDVSEDRELGRLYLAREDLETCGCTAADVAAGGDRPALARLANLYVGRTAACFQDAARLDQLLTTDGRIVFRAMFGVYHALFKAVRRAGTTIFTRRVQPSRPLLLAKTLAGVLTGPRP